MKKMSLICLIVCILIGCQKTKDAEHWILSQDFTRVWSDSVRSFVDSSCVYTDKKEFVKKIFLSFFSNKEEGIRFVYS